MRHSRPYISIVGAGPGDPELITVKALKAIQKADVILYDALVNQELLRHAKPGVILRFVGKRAGLHSYRQEEINLLMVQHAYKYGRVVRLKGGDPFVFGRGHEELEYARAFDIPVEVIPGISSAIAVPASQHIPMTNRGMAESFWVLTATTKSDKLATDVRLAAQSSATVVLLMGIRKLTQIAEIYLSLEKAFTPVMIVQNGTLPEEKVVVGRIENIVEKAQEEQIGTPGIIVIGENVSLHPEYINQVVNVTRTWK